jgi:hypothetical protein
MDAGTDRLFVILCVTLRSAVYAFMPASARYSRITFA